ncbi:MAG: hypothetical protein V8Q90_00020 [Bacilli bacterium]
MLKYTGYDLAKGEDSELYFSNPKGQIDGDSVAVTTLFISMLFAIIMKKNLKSNNLRVKILLVFPPFKILN